MKHTLTVAKFTFIEVYRSKVMASIIFMAAGLLLITYIASEFAYGAPAKIALDLGLGLMTISNLIMSIFIGSTLLNKEIEQKTLYMILSRSISRTSFLIGKIIGLSTILLVNTFLLSGMGVLIFLYLGGNYHYLILWAVYFSFIEAFLLLLFSILFSLLTNTTMAVIYSIVIFIVGHALNETSKIFLAKNSAFFHAALSLAEIILPNFYKLNLKDFILYRQDITMSYLLGIQLYSILYIGFLLCIISYIFKNKNLD
jgi:ABC-type transport system involved in multi-copper enzyme maturation permease subunit